MKYKKENLYSYVMVSDGKTMLSYVNDFYSKNKNWDSLMEKYQIDQSPEILVPCRIFANNWNNRKWTKERQNSWNSKWD